MSDSSSDDERIIKTQSNNNNNKKMKNHSLPNSDPPVTFKKRKRPNRRTKKRKSNKKRTLSQLNQDNVNTNINMKNQPPIKKRKTIPYNFKSNLFPNKDDHNSFIQISQTITNMNNVNISSLAIQHIAEYAVGKVAKCANFEQCKVEEILLLKEYENKHYYNNHDVYIFCKKCMKKLRNCEYPGCSKKDIKEKMISCQCRKWNKNDFKTNDYLNKYRDQYCRYHLHNKEVIKCKNINCNNLICTEAEPEIINRTRYRPNILHRCQIICGLCENIVNQQYCSVVCGNDESVFCGNKHPTNGYCTEYICSCCYKKYSCFGDNDKCQKIFCRDCRAHNNLNGGYSTDCDHCHKQLCLQHADDLDFCKKTPYKECKKCKYGACSLCIGKTVKCKYKKCKSRNCANQYRECKGCKRKICKSHMNKRNVEFCKECTAI